MHATLNHRAMAEIPHKGRHLAYVAALVGAMVLGSGAAARAAETSAAAFLQGAAQIDIAEVGAGKLAQQKSENAAVKDFGKMLEADHAQHLTAVQDLAKSMGISIPAEPAAADKNEAEKLQGLSGRAFDQEFVKHMVDGHQMAITKYEAEAKAGNADTSALAQKTLPALQHHLEAAEALQKALGQQAAQ